MGAMDVVPTNTGGVAIMAQAAHPYSAALMADFLLVPKAQKFSATWNMAVR